MFDVDVAAQAELDEGREVSETLKKDQQYYLKIRARKDRNGVRVHVRYWALYVDEVIIKERLETITIAEPLQNRQLAQNPQSLIVFHHNGSIYTYNITMK